MPTWLGHWLPRELVKKKKKNLDVSVCFQMRLTFELAGWVKQIALLNMGRPCPTHWWTNRLEQSGRVTENSLSAWWVPSWDMGLLLPSDECSDWNFYHQLAWFSDIQIQTLPGQLKIQELLSLCYCESISHHFSVHILLVCFSEALRLIQYFHI